MEWSSFPASWKRSQNIWKQCNSLESLEKRPKFVNNKVLTAFLDLLWVSSDLSCDGQQLKRCQKLQMKPNCETFRIFAKLFCNWFIKSLKRKVFRVKYKIICNCWVHCCVVQSGWGHKIGKRKRNISCCWISCRWIFQQLGKRKKNISCCSTVANSDTDGSQEKKYFLTDNSILFL